jgi:hypothetical protein
MAKAFLGMTDSAAGIAAVVGILLAVVAEGTELAKLLGLTEVAKDDR